MTIRTRFAPSPTGSLHLGSARTALFAWAYARHMQGEFVLRIEDTDQQRSEQKYVDMILEGMQWLGLSFDIGPVYQSQRTERYREVKQQLLNAGLAYCCNCSRERLDELRESQQAQKQKPRYDGCCRDKNLPMQAGCVVRFKNPLDGQVRFNDQVRGEVIFNNSELDDLIIWRSDDTPTYNFVVVIDDMDMEITHVIRGDDHTNNTPRQLNIFYALNKTPPSYAHIPMILGPDMKKLSKRHGALSILEYRDNGILPEALINYLARLGWSHGDDEIFSCQQLIEWFELASLNKSAAAYDPEKLNWLNQHYMVHSDPASILPALTHQFELADIDTNHGPALRELFEVQKSRNKTLKEIVEKSQYFYSEFDDYDEAALDKHLSQAALPVIDYMSNAMQSVEWSKQSIKETIAAAAESLQLKMGNVAQPLRVALTGNTISPSIDDTILLIGRERCLKRLQRAQQQIISASA